MDQNFTGILIVGIIFFSVSAISITGCIVGYLTKKEKIKAEAMIRAEEIQARNRLEIEAMLNNNTRNIEFENINNNRPNNSNFADDIREVRERKRQNF